MSTNEFPDRSRIIRLPRILDYFAISRSTLYE